MKEFKMVKSEDFCGVKCDFYSNDENIGMTASQLGSCLGYSDPVRNISKLVSRNEYLDKEEFSRVARLTTLDGKERDVRLFTEDGIYEVTMLSKTEKAKEFRAFVRTVVKSIRKHGAYMTEQTLEKALTSPDFLIQLATKLKEEQEKNKSLQNKIEEDRPKVVFADAVSVSDDCILIRDLAKLLKQNGFNLGEKKLFALLRNKKYLIKTGVSYNTPTQKAMEMGIFKLRETVVTDNNGKTHIVKTTMVTAKGQEYFLSKLIKMKEDYLKNLEIGKGE